MGRGRGSAGRSSATSASSGERAPSFRAPELALLAVTSLVWGAAYVFIRSGIEAGASPLAYAAVRYLLAAAGFAALALAARAPAPSRRALGISMAVGGLLVIGLYGGLLYWGEQFTTGGYAALLASTAPLWTVICGIVLLGSERLGGRGLFGIAVGFAGSVVLVLPQLLGTRIGSWEGPVFILAAMLSTAVGTVLLRRYGGGPQGLWQISAQFVTAGALLSGAALALPVPEALPWDPAVLVPLAALVLASSLVGYFAYYALHHRVGPVRANVVAYLAPLVGLAVGSGFYGEPVTVWEVVGVLVVLSGVTLVLSDVARRSPTVR